MRAIGSVSMVGCIFDIHIRQSTSQWLPAIVWTGGDMASWVCCMMCVLMAQEVMKPHVLDLVVTIYLHPCTLLCTDTACNHAAKEGHDMCAFLWPCWTHPCPMKVYMHKHGQYYTACTIQYINKYIYIYIYIYIYTLDIRWCAGLLLLAHDYS